MKFETSECLLISSDDGPLGVFLVLKPFDSRQLMLSYVEQLPDQKEEQFEQFINWLKEQGIISAIEYKEFHLGRGETA